MYIILYSLANFISKSLLVIVTSSDSMVEEIVTSQLYNPASDNTRGSKVNVDEFVPTCVLLGVVLNHW